MKFAHSSLYLHKTLQFWLHLQCWSYSPSARALNCDRIGGRGSFCGRFPTIVLSFLTLQLQRRLRLLAGSERDEIDIDLVPHRRGADRRRWS